MSVSTVAAKEGRRPLTTSFAISKHSTGEKVEATHKPW